MAVQDLVVLVTGAARGMGREYVRGFLHAGAKVIATALCWAPTGVPKDAAVFREKLKRNEHVRVEVMEITIAPPVRGVSQAALARSGPVDVIDNNAGRRQRDLPPPHGSVTT